MTFAGSTVVHTIGGMVALAGAIVLGPRLGRKFKRDGGGPMMPPRSDDCGFGGTIAVVRLVRIQSGLVAFGDGLCRDWTHLCQHHAGGVRSRIDGDVYGVPDDEESGT